MERQPATQAQSCRLLLPEPPCLLCVANRPQQTRQPLQVAAESGPPPHCRSPSWTGAAGTPCWACARCSGTPAQRGKGAAGTAKQFRIERGAAELSRGGGMCRVPPSSHAGLFDTRGTATRTSACSRLQRAAAAAGEVALLSSPTLFPSAATQQTHLGNGMGHDAGRVIRAHHRVRLARARHTIWREGGKPPAWRERGSAARSRCATDRALKDACLAVHHGVDIAHKPSAREV